MPSDNIEMLLQADFDDLAGRLENDRFEKRLQFRLAARSRARLGVIGLAGGLGAAFAASQFADLGRLAAPYLAKALPSYTVSIDTATQLSAAVVLAAAVITTALVLRQDT
ncbi:MAG: hypothetical protein GXP06_09580 [Alphaproteobacteria bacterium]|nr:hypothetical protein [Alphaproteobacteria bacterium]